MDSAHVNTKASQANAWRLAHAELTDLLMSAPLSASAILERLFDHFEYRNKD